MGLSADAAATRGLARLSGDFRITQAHGLQLDLSTTDYAQGYLGQIDGHLYLMPGNRSKYGFFASLSDVDGREATIAYAGAEGLWALSDGTVLGARAGMGYARPGHLDFVAADLRVDHALSRTFGVFASVDLAKVREQDFDTLPWGAELGLTWQPSRLPVELTALIGSTGLAGRDSADAEPYAQLSLTWEFGSPSGDQNPLGGKGFRPPSPFDPLLRQGRF